MRRLILRSRYPSHLWLMILALLALAGLGWVEETMVRRSFAAGTSALEPVFSLPGGYYDHDLQLELGAPDPHASVIFTLDGRAPTYMVGAVYTQPIRLSAATPNVTVVRARVARPDGEMGEVVSASYFMGVSATLPIMSLIVEPDDLWGAESGIFANFTKKGVEWERPVDVTYVDVDRRSGFHLPSGLRVLGGYSRYFGKKSLQLYFRQEYGASRLEYPLFADSEVRSFKRLVLHGGGQDWHVYRPTNWTMMRNQLASRLAFQVGAFATHSRPVLLFINGELWGIYQIREHMDRYFLADQYGFKSTDFLETPELPGQRLVIAGDDEYWDHLTRFVETHDLADPANYAYVQTQVDIPAFIDYYVLQIYAANIDWPHHNVHQFRPRVQGGRWRWLFWDSDHGFGMYMRSYVSTNMMKRLLDSDDPETKGRDVLLIRKLLENEGFRGRFLSRAADLLNTVLASESVVRHIDVLAAELAPDMAYEAERWTSTTDWGANIQEMREFARERPGYVRQHMVNRFDLGGVVRLSINPPASGEGGVAVNGWLVPGLGWGGEYFVGVPVEVMAAPEAGYRFAGWLPAELPQSAVITLTLSAPLTLTPRFERVGSEEARAGDVVIAGYHIDEEGEIEGDWFELEVRRGGGIDLRGWRVTDNDGKAASDEGSLVFGEALGWVPQGTRIVVVASETEGNTARYGEDDVSAWWDGRLVVYVGNGNMEMEGWFELGPRDNLALLAPGASAALGDDVGIDFVSWSAAVTPASFGVLADGVRGRESQIQNQ